MSEHNPLEDIELLDVIQARINSGFDLLKDPGEADVYKTLQLMEFVGLMQETHDMLTGALYRRADK